MLRSTKIVATLGPASSEPAVLERMIRAGVDVVRLNFSHGTADDHLNRAALVKEIASKVGRTVAIMCDLQGPKIRVGKFKEGKVTLEKGARFILDAGIEMGDGERCRPRLQGTAARRRGGRAAVARRRQDRARGHQRARQRSAHHGAPRRRAVEQQGHQPPGRRADRAGADRQGHGGHPDRHQAAGRLPGGVVPEERRRHVHGARADARRRRQGVPDRQDRARRGGRRGRAARHHARLATASWWRAATSRSRSATRRCRRCRRR